MDEYGRITLEDINNLSIVKKFVSIDSSKYDEEAFNRILELIDEEQAILFDKDTHKIYTLGTFYGGNLSKDDFWYFSSIINIDNADEIISKIEALKNEDELSIHGENGILIELKEGSKINISIDTNQLISEEKTKINIGDKQYSLGLNNDKLDLKEYESPSIIIDKILIDYNEDNNIVDIPFEIKGSLSINEFSKFDLTIENGELDSFDDENNIIKIIPESRYLTPSINISYGDEYITKNETFIINWNIKCYYGIFFENEEYLLGEFNIDNWKLDNYITIDQHQNEYAYFSCPKNITPMFIDNNTKIQGAWHKIPITNMINGIVYNFYISDNEGLGKNEWHIINKK